MAETFEYVDPAGNPWTFYAPDPPNTMWAGALKAPAYGQSAGKRIIAGLSSDDLTAEAAKFASGERKAPGGTLNVPVTPDDVPAPKSKDNGGGWVLLALLALVVFGKEKRRR